MYKDPSLIRDHVLKVRLNEREFALIDALSDYTGEQLATMAREMLLDHARHVLFGNSAGSGAGSEGHYPARIAA